MVNNGTYEDDVRKLVAYDNFDIPLNALHKRIDKRHKDLAVQVGEFYESGEADFGVAMVNVEYRDKQKARVVREAIDEFCEAHPRVADDLRARIAVKRSERETYLQYGILEGSRVSSADYMAAMTDCGLTEAQAEALYPAVLDTSRILQRARGKKTTSSGLREVLIGKD